MCLPQLKTRDSLVLVMASKPDNRTIAPANLGEAELVAGLQAGDPAAFERLVREYSMRMLAVARRLLINEEDARDALQDAFVSAYRAGKNFEGKSRLSTWLHRIVTNAALMKLRSRKNKNEQSIEPLLPKFLEDGHQADPSKEWQQSVVGHVQSSETQEYIRKRITELPDNYRTVLVLRDIEQMSTEETADMLGIETNLVKVRLHRARQALRTLLDEQFKAQAI